MTAMNIGNLYSHNIAAYNSSMAMLREKGQAAVIHPTGTGKSYVIAAVCSHYSHPVIIGPNTVVLNQVQDTISKVDGDRKVECHTLQWLLMQQPGQIPGGCDLIVIDEFHRAGAVEWGSALERLRKQNPKAHLFGTTATPVRPSDGGRNMAEELFENDIASEMTLTQAWQQHILPIPHYVTGLYTFDNVAIDAEQRIKSTNRLTEQEKKYRLSELRSIKVDWLRSNGMRQIVNRYVGKDVRRVIIFCANIEHLKQVRPCIGEWFADMPVEGISSIHSKQSERQQRQTIEYFTSDEGERNGMRILLSVNMLNEGLHVDGADCVIMLRKTASNIVYRQQIGRCLSAGNAAGRRPVILDMTDNLSTHTAIRRATPSAGNNAPRERVDDDEMLLAMQVTDLLQGTRELVKRLTEDIRQGHRALTLEEHAAVVREYGRQFGCLPVSGAFPAVASWAWLRINHGDSEEVKALREEFGRLETAESFRDKYIAYVRQHHKLPVQASNDKKERQMANRWIYFRKELINDPEIRQLRELYSVVHRKLTDRIERVEQFCKEHGRQPTANDGEIFKEWNGLRYGPYKYDSRIVALRNEYQKETRRHDDVDIMKRLKPAFDFLEDQQRLPRVSGPWVTEEEKRIYHQIYELGRRGAQHPTEQKLLDFVEQIRNIKKVKLQICK